MKINTIKLENTLPRVFAGAEGDGHVKASQVWLHDLTFSRPEHYMIEAESGTGKSSLCSFIYGNRRDYLGIIRFNDRDISTLSIKEWCEIRRTSLALLPQEMRLFPELTAMENIMIKNRLTGRYGRDEIMSMLDRLEIAGKADQKASRLSVGQQQRVALVRAICQPFDFIILDEPVSHLDRRNNLIVAGLIAEAAQSNNAAIITTSVGNPLLLDEVTSVTPHHIKL